MIHVGRPLNRRSLYGRMVCAALTVAPLAPAAAADGAAKPVSASDRPLHPNDALTGPPGRLTDVDRGEQQQALDEARGAAGSAPELAEAHHRLAVLAARQAEWLEAVEHLRRTLQLAPGNTAAANHLAWIWAVCPSADFRSGAEALALAERLCRESREENPTLLDTLAAALAEQGRFEEAVAAAESAVRLARAAHRDGEQAQIAVRVELYRQGQSYRP